MVGDAAAAGRDGHALPGPDPAAQVEPGKLGVDLAGHVLDLRGFKYLP